MFPLRKWEQGEWLKQINHEWSKNEVSKERLTKVEQTLTEQNDKAPLWYVNTQSQTMIVIPGPVEFMMGSNESDVGHQKNERQHLRRIRRTFALTATTVTFEQYRQFEKDYGEEFDNLWASQNNLPAIYICWHRGAGYCNWLSKQEKLDQCYQINGGDISLKENYLGLSGYRFPTEAEMEYATRAGAITSRYFGETDSLLSKYAWYEKNSLNVPQPVGLLKPNDFGFFDIQGNGWCWCQDRYVDYPKGDDSVDDKEDTESFVKVDVPRVVRGGSFESKASDVRSADRMALLPATDTANIGSFRIARTLPPVSGGERN